MRVTVRVVDATPSDTQTLLDFSKPDAACHGAAHEPRVSAVDTFSAWLNNQTDNRTR
jgi:hypothetical protein